MAHKTLFDLMDKRYELIYVDRNSSLDGREKEVQQCVQSGSWEALDDSLWEWEMDCRDSGLQYARDELAREIHAKLGGRFYDFDIQQYLDLHREEIEEELLNRDDSTFYADLVRNTGSFVSFYSTGYSVGDTCFMEDAEWKQTIREMKKVLGIKGKDYDKKLGGLLADAGYGGELVIYFQMDDFEEFMKSEHNTITFRNPVIAIINTFNGSGGDTYLENHVFSLPLNRENIYLDKAIKYNYTYAVCGMSSDWCRHTDVSLSKTKLTRRLGQSFIGARQREDDELTAKFKKGECTLGDMDMKRHKNIRYTNDGTCGSYCPTCQTFWTD